MEFAWSYSISHKKRIQMIAQIATFASINWIPSI